ncbi:MAG: DUF2961 domain-containing protein [Phycisphaerales bacterium]|nr:MAG: DUF2961 domain-containing protein [Phycisphaerales bacterium]
MKVTPILSLVLALFLSVQGTAESSHRPSPAMLAQSAEPPTIPVGLDAYRMWDKVPYHRIGVRAYMRSTYDREGNNRSADASHYLYQESDDFNVTLDTRGPGVLYFKRTNHWHGSPWHYEIDGKDFVVQETATQDPVNAKKRLSETQFIPAKLFPNPLTWTWSITKGADLMWVPLPFEDSLRIAYTRTFYGTGYYIYHLFSPGMTNLSQPIASWDRRPPDQEVLDLIARAGTDIAPKGENVETVTGTLTLKRHEWATVCELTDAPAAVRALKFTVPRDRAYDFGKCRLRVTWDRRWHASIDAPVDLFFGTGHLYNSDDREYLVKGFPLVVRYDDDHVHLACYWPMPFFRHAKIELQDRRGLPLNDVTWEVRTVPFTGPINHASYFHATYSDHPEPELGRDITFLDTSRVEGGGSWSGNFVGMSWIFSHDGFLPTLEGDPRFFFDGSWTPQAWGTGTEEWGGGGDYWGGRNMTLPFAGHPVGAEKKLAKNDLDLINSAYRFLIADMFPFGKRAVVRLEHGGLNDSTEHYEGVVYWYGTDAPTLVLTDHFHTCDTKIEQREHEYRSPTAGSPYTLVSRYEWGPDHRGARLHFPAEEDQVRTMKGTSRFKMRLDPNNLGVLLRRKFDYQYPNQRANVSVRPDREGSAWRYVGQWYTPGSNTCVYSYPRAEGELGQTQHTVITGNRRWREEEFLIPRHSTEGVSRLEIQIEFVPSEKQLFPGHPFPVESAWSESRYWAYCYKMPEVTLPTRRGGE